MSFPLAMREVSNSGIPQLITIESIITFRIKTYESNYQNCSAYTWESIWLMLQRFCPTLAPCLQYITVILFLTGLPKSMYHMTRQTNIILNTSLTKATRALTFRLSLITKQIKKVLWFFYIIFFFYPYFLLPLLPYLELQQSLLTKGFGPNQSKAENLTYQQSPEDW